MIRRLGGISRVVALVAAPLALLAALVTWGFSSPVASSADEDFHLASIWCGTGIREDLCEEGSGTEFRRVPLELIAASECFAGKPEQAASCPARDPSILLDTARGNFAGIYPPVFYATMGVFASTDISDSVLIMRMFNSIVYVAMMTTLFLLIAPRRRAILIWGSLATFAPFGVFLIPSVNPSSWAVISASTLWIAVLGYFEAETTRRRVALGAVAAVAVLLGAGSRADAAAFAVVSILLVGALKSERSRTFLRLSVLPAVLIVAAVLSFLFAGQANAVNPGVEITVAGDPATSPRSWASLLWNNLIRLPELWAGGFGAPLGGRALWHYTTVPGAIWFPSILAFGGIVFLGLRRLNLRKALAIIAVVGLLVVLPLLWLMRDEILVGQAVQPRYLYPLLIILAGVCLLGFRGTDAGLGRVQIVMVAAAAFVAHVVTQWFTLRRFTTGLDEYWINLDLGIEWWWPSLPIGPMPVWLIGSLAFGVVCGACVAFGWRGDDAPPSAHLASARDLAISPRAGERRGPPSADSDFDPQVGRSADRG